MADTTGRELTYGRTLASAILVSNWLRNGAGLPAGPDGGPPVGVMLPASVGGALVNIGITLAGRVPVNLNFTAGPKALASAVTQCGIRTIVTSRVFLAKAKMAPMDGTVFLEDVLAGAGRWAKLRALLAARFAPAARLAHGRRTPDSMAAIIFSSGTAGEPKGIALSHYNLLSNIDAIAQVFPVGERDRVTGALPFFHSFGFTVSVWFPLIAGCGAVYHSNPSDARAIGELIAKYRATLLIGAPTFCATYARKCERDQFSSLRYVLVGAEKLRAPVAAAFREKFGLELLEGYGCTEMSPVVAVNRPNFEAGKETQTGNKAGTVGHPLPGVAAKIVDPVTYAPLGPNREGLLLVKGPNRMIGYLNDARRTADALHDGWYITGDVALIDDEGFIRITDRLARFSKMGGEMVPHGRVEEAIGAILGEHPCAVTAIDDEQRGERLVALYSCPDISPAELWRRLSETGLPRLWIPKRENLYPVDELPRMGTGKLDLRAVKERARELASTSTEERG
jgi:acyl-[acyl-carrier-protein]-phospholipid O-acyltransferase/long-chain-fatty-acid--[acyl-carrier-protein] ligase